VSYRSLYRAILCIAWTMPSQHVCPSVCPSVTRRCSIETAKHIIKRFHRRVATPVSFFRTERYGNIPTKTPLTGASNAGSVWKNRDSRQISGVDVRRVCHQHFDGRVRLCDSTCVSSVSRYQQTPPRHASVNLVYDRKWRSYAEDNRTEFNCTHR